MMPAHHRAWASKYEEMPCVYRFKFHAFSLAFEESNDVCFFVSFASSPKLVVTDITEIASIVSMQNAVCKGKKPTTTKAKASENNLIFLAWIK